MFTAAQSIIAANHPGRPAPGAVLVADSLLWPNRPSVACPAAVLLDGELRRRGVRTQRGHLHADAADHDGVSLRTVLPGIGGFGAAVTRPTSRVTEALCGAMAACLAVAGPPRRVLLATPRSFCPDVERAIEVIDEAAEAVGELRTRFPAPRGPASDDIRYAATNRQDALEAVAADSDLVLVVGSKNSANSVRLVELARRGGALAYLVDNAGEIRPQWLAEVRTIGLTAGPSASPRLVNTVIDALGGLGPVTVDERQAPTMRASSPGSPCPSPVR